MTNTKINLHTHSSFCDGKNTAEEMVLSAIERGLTVLGFSGHCMYPLDPEFYKPVDSLWHMPLAAIDDYAAEIRRLAKKYEDKIKILLGFEADYFCSERYGTAVPDKTAYSKFAPDYLIGSVHFINCSEEEFGFYSVDNKAEFVQQALTKFYAKPDGTIDGKAAVCDYFEAERQMLARGNFEIMGHPDLIRLRNTSLHFFDEADSWYKEQLKLTAKAAATAGVIAEINTGAVARGLMSQLYPSPQFLEYLRAAGVTVCINTDSHKTDTIDFGLDSSMAYAKKAGYDELSYPVEGKLVHIKL